jgi:hypothetical protein
MANTEVTGAIVNKSGVVLTAYMKDQDFADITKAALAAITYTLFDATNGNSPVAIAGYENLPVDIATTVYDTVQTPGANAGLSNKYNFRHVLAAAPFTNKASYRAEYRFSPVSGEPFYLIATLGAKLVYST